MVFSRVCRRAALRASSFLIIACCSVSRCNDSANRFSTSIFSARMVSSSAHIPRYMAASLFLCCSMRRSRSRAASARRSSLAFRLLSARSTRIFAASFCLSQADCMSRYLSSWRARIDRSWERLVFSVDSRETTWLVSTVVDAVPSLAMPQWEFISAPATVTVGFFTLRATARGCLSRDGVLARLAPGLLLLDRRAPPSSNSTDCLPPGAMEFGLDRTFGVPGSASSVPALGRAEEALEDFRGVG
mmetsp:Transcript_42985/g.103588  ORF Transcript_42985/g.103588 Transcript_42985/m.103588 type:complete len:245 (+) Transcript_42985:550-1284(+)